MYSNANLTQVKSLTFLVFIFIFRFIHVTAESTDSLIVLDKAGYVKTIVANATHRLFSIDSLPVSNIKLEIRYSTANNFTGEPVYNRPAAYARFEVAQALRLVADSLKSLGMGLLIYDAYRPYSATVRFWELIGDERYVANPQKGSRHNRGCAVDVGLYDLIDGENLPMPTAYDDFTEQAHAEAECTTAPACRNRRVLQLVMTWAGFRIFETEWWHFDYKGWEEFPVLDVSFEDLDAL